MSNGKRRKKGSVPINSVFGVFVAFAIVLVTLVLFLQKERSDSLIPQQSIPKSKVTINHDKTIRVIDGDTIEVNAEKIRIHGIDAPEKGQPCKKNGATYNCGAASKEYLKLLITGATVSCDNRGKGRWGRRIAVCRADAKDIGKMMVRHGWAIAYREYSSDYIEDEYFAKNNELGMWSKNFSLPSEWRKSRKN